MLYSKAKHDPAPDGIVYPTPSATDLIGATIDLSVLQARKSNAPQIGASIISETSYPRAAKVADPDVGSHIS